MKTELLTASQLPRAAEILLSGGLVAIPTETVYGLGANGLNEEAVARIHETLPYHSGGTKNSNSVLFHMSASYYQSVTM